MEEGKPNDDLSSGTEGRQLEKFSLELLDFSTEVSAADALDYLSFLLKAKTQQRHICGLTGV